MFEEEDSFRCWICAERVWKEPEIAKPFDLAKWRASGSLAKAEAGKKGKSTNPFGRKNVTRSMTNNDKREVLMRRLQHELDGLMRDARMMG
jgi:hypothetical protein